MEAIISWLMSKFGLAAVIGLLGTLGIGYQAIKSKIDIQRERIGRQTAEMDKQAAKIQASVERQKRNRAEQAAELERRRNAALSKELKAERKQKKREGKIHDQESSELVADGLDNLFDVPDSGLSDDNAGPGADGVD